MKISAQEEYGLRCLLQLANLPAGESLTLPQIAELEGISTANAGKLMWLLNKAGFVQSTRGTKGGYFLARPAADIFVSCTGWRKRRSRRPTSRIKRRKRTDARGIAAAAIITTAPTCTRPSRSITES